MRNPIRRIHNLDRAERRAQNPDFKGMKDPIRRIFYLDRAYKRAKNPEFKKLWRLKKEQLLKKYNI